MADDSPQEVFKRALAHAARALAEQPDLEVAFASDGPRLTEHLLTLHVWSRAAGRKEADEIISSAKLEATELLNASEEKARSTAEKIATEARADIEKSIETAKRELHDETLELIAFATEKVIRKKLDKKADAELIAEALKESK